LKRVRRGTSPLSRRAARRLAFGVAEVPAPAPGAPGTPTRTPAPLPGVVPEGTPLPGEEEPTDETGAPIELPPGTMPTQREQELAAERALVAIVSGGQCRPGSLALPPLIQLDAPFRTQQDGTVYSPTNSSTASLAMVLGAYGVEVALVDLRALLNGLEGTYSPSSTPRIETIARVAERAGLNVVDLYRGTRFNEWTVEGVREMIRRGYPTITLVQGAVLPGGTPPGVARERFITIVGMDGDALIYHDPAYPDDGTGATRRVNARQLEQAWLAASTSRLAAAFSLGPEGRGLLECGRVSGTPGTPQAVATPAPGIAATATPVATLAPTPEPPSPEYPFGLPIHPLLLAFLLLLLVLLILVLVRLLR
jgi:hypothetical protein